MNKRLSNQELMNFIQSTIRSGVPLHAGLRTLAHELTDDKQRRIIEDISGRLEKGEDPVTVFKSEETNLSPELMYIFSALNVHKRPDRIISALSRISQTRDSFISQISVLTIYPLAVIFLAFCILVLQFKTIILPAADFLEGVTPNYLKPISQVFTFLGNNHWIAIVVVTFIFVGLLWFLLARTNEGNRYLLVKKMPLLRELLRMKTMAHYFNILAIAMDSSLPFSDALKVASLSIADSDIIKMTALKSRDLESGQQISEFLSEFSVIPTHARAFLITAAKHDNLIPSLRDCSEFYAREAEMNEPVVLRFYQVAWALIGGLFVIVATINLFTHLWGMVNSPNIWGVL